MQVINYSRWLTLGAALLLQACANVTPAITPTIEYDRDYDFSNVKKIAIQPIARDTIATMRITDLQISRIDTALTEALLLQGLEVVSDNAEADMFLSWRYITSESSRPNPFDSSAPEYIIGTLYVNMIDPIVLQPKWRAIFRAHMHIQPESAEGVVFREKAARAILADFPPDRP
ncbi:MAG: DUF4136 domain-containing protein [Halieaceae bacterium]|nr:DUF4136 domain-containing protein [Halieaceae bacterium]